MRIKNQFITVFLANFLFLIFFSCISANAQITSVSQFSDVSEKDSYYSDLQNLVEKYGCIAIVNDNGELIEGTFNASKIVTRYEFASHLSSCLDQIIQNDSSGMLRRRLNKYSSVFDSSVNTDSVSQLRDVFPTHWTFGALQRLVETYDILPGLPDGTFQGDKALTYGELADYMNGIFGYRSIPIRNGSMTRGEFMIYLNRSLDFAFSDITQ
jgi:hypothetical protein